MDDKASIQAAFLTIFGSGDVSTPSGWKFSNTSVALQAQDISIDGLTLPTLGWGWIGLSMATGVLSAVGGLIVKGLFDLITSSGQQAGPSLGELLSIQLQQFTSYVSEAIDASEVTDCQSRVEGLAQSYHEYLNDPKLETLNLIVEDSALALSRAKSLGFSGYPTYMTCANLRLLILQDVIKREGASKGASANFWQQMGDAITYHKSMEDRIDLETTPGYRVKNSPPGGRNQLTDTIAGMFYATNNPLPPGASLPSYLANAPTMLMGIRMYGAILILPGEVASVDDPSFDSNVNRPFLNLGPPPGGHPVPVPSFNPHVWLPIDLPKLRTDIKTASTDIGRVMVRRWLHSTVA